MPDTVLNADYGIMDKIDTISTFIAGTMDWKQIPEIYLWDMQSKYLSHSEVDTM